MTKTEILKLSASVLYYFLLSPLIIIGIAPLYIILTLDKLRRDGYCLSIAQFRSELQDK